MMLDIRSFWLIGAVCSLGFGFLLLLVRKAYPDDLRRMLLYCGAASICLGAGWTLLLEENSLEQFAFLVLSRVLLSLSLTLQYRAISNLKGHQAPIAWVVAPPVLVFAICTWFGFAQRNLTVMVILFSTIQVATMALLVRTLLKPEEGKRPFIDIVLAALYSLFAVSTSLVVAVLVWKGQFAADYDFNNWRSIYNNMAAICVFLAAFSMYPIMASERLNRQLTVQAMSDPLTGLYNRRSFEEIAFRELAGATRTGLPVSVLVFDIDRFKAVNDMHGHSVGDLVLKAAADVLRRGLRNEDFLCRWGGDEFCALLPRANRDQAQQIAERMLQSFDGFTFTHHGNAIGIEISIGIMTDVNHALALPALVEMADAALYQAKQSGRKRFVSAPACGPDPA